MGVLQILTRGNRPEDQDRALSLPTIPGVLAQVTEELGRPEPSARRIIDLVSRDPNLASAVLVMVNSPMYGLPGQVASIGRAVNLLGLRTLKTAIIVPALKTALSMPNDLSRFLWQRSLLTAAAAGALAERVSDLDREHAYLVGLFHDMGSLLLAQEYDDYPVLFDLARTSGTAMGPLERDRYGTTHVQIAAGLADSWALPSPILAAIAQQAHPRFDGLTDREVRRLISALHLVREVADALTPYLGRSIAKMTLPMEVRLRALAELSIPSEALDHLSSALYQALAADAARIREI